MIRRAGPSDAAAMERFLARHAETSMFLRGNLEAQGTEEAHHRHGTTFYLAEREGEICGIAGVTNGGYLMCQSRDAPQGFFEAFADRLRGRSLLGMTGEPSQVAAVLEALGCQQSTFAVRRGEPLYAITLAEIDEKWAIGNDLQEPRPADVDWLGQWFEGYHADTGLVASDPEQAARLFIAHSDARIMIKEGQPVAMCNFNARAKDTVQIGGVYVPPECRGKGFGGEIVARHLTEAARNGIETAILFAATPQAARAYEKIGFKQKGTYEITLFAEPFRVPE